MAEKPKKGDDEEGEEAAPQAEAGQPEPASTSEGEPAAPQTEAGQPEPALTSEGEDEDTTAQDSTTEPITKTEPTTKTETETTTKTETTPKSALADILGSDPNEEKPPPEKAGKKKGKRGKKGSKKKKGKKGKKKKKKKKKKDVQSEAKAPGPVAPQYSQKDIDDYIMKRDKEKKKRREDRLVGKMRELVTLVPSDDIRWTTYTLAPLYQFLRRPEVEVITAFFHQEEVRKEEKKLLFADSNLDDNSISNDKKALSATKSASSDVSNPTASPSNSKLKKKSKVFGQFRGSKGWARMSMNKGSDGLSLIVLNAVVPNSSLDLFYFVKLNKMALDKDTFFENVLFGNIPGGTVSALTNLLKYVFAPMFSIPGVLPESVQNEFFAGLTNLMSTVTEAHHRLQAQTVLYVPEEATAYPIDIASKNKELCARLENTMINWIRQIKEVVNTQSFGDIDDWAGPLDEIAFWKARSEDLAGLTAQVQSKAIRTVKEIMTIIKSPFLAGFEAATSEILKASGEAISNLYYLQVLTEPCNRLHESTVEEIPGQIQNLLWLVRVIWLNSPYYNTRERLNSLLRKISNEIVLHCIGEIDIDLVFNGFIDTSEGSIKRCMDCVTFWKTKYFEAEKMHHMNSHLTWLLEYDQIFAFVDGFLKRLKDLQEICMCQRLYARRVEGYQEPLPLYPGLKGPEVYRVMKEIQRLMDRHLRDLYAAQSYVFDVKNTTWTDAMNNFKSAIRDIEMMIQNVLNSFFDTVTTLDQGIQILETFYVYYQRDIIRRTYDQLIMKLYKLLEDDTIIVKNLHASQVLPLPLVYPNYSGRAAWANFMYDRLNTQLERLKKAWWLPECGYGDDVKEQARVVNKQLKDHAAKMYQEWLKVVGTKDHKSRLDIPLMIRSTYKPGMIEVNFDKTLYKHIIEAEMWARMGKEIPVVLQFVYGQRDRLHNLRESVLLVVKDYNRIIQSLSIEERSLFKERIKLLGRKVYPGLTRLTWASNISDSYINDCRLAATKVQGFTANYKNANVKIGKLATKISNILMIKVDMKRLYQKNEFNEYQEAHRVKTVLKIANEYKNVTVILRSVFEMFRSDGNEVKAQWVKYLKKIDDVIEEAFCLNIQRSLEILVRLVHGDVRGPSPPIFRIMATLTKNQLAFIPTVMELEDMICGIYRRICVTVQPFPRVIQFLADTSTKVVSFSQAMARNVAARQKQEHIAHGMKNTLVEVAKYLESWSQFREVWETNKDVFMAHYEDNSPTVKAYDTDIGRYWEIADAVQGFESTVAVGICIIDCSDLKDIVIKHCHEWQHRILTNLYKKAVEKMNSVYKYMEDNKKPFKKEPKNLPDLINAYNLFRNIQMDASKKEKDFPRMHEQFGILAKYNYDLGDQVRKRYSNFTSEWHAYNQALRDIEYMLKQAKEKLRKLFLAMAENFQTRVQELVRALQKDGPYTGSVKSSAAMLQLKGYRKRMEKLEKEQVELLSSLQIFEIEMPPNQDLRNFEGDLSNIESVWVVVHEWEGYWSEYKTVPFKDMQTGDMEDVAGIMIKKLIQLQQTFEKKNWPVIEDTLNRIEVFKKSIPVIHEIKTPALRERHWEQIFQTIGARFNPEDPKFTFERIVSYGMDKYADEIAEIASTAQKELLIEKTMIQIRSYWTSEKLEMVPYKDGDHFRLKINQEMMQNLEDNNVMISAMKGSRYAKPFEVEITYWEKTLSVVNDVFDIFLNVQRQWMYLENIFLGEDIRRQLPKESQEFKIIDSVWKNITERMNDDEFVIPATHRDNLIPVLKELSDRLEAILKSLEIFLEAKRQGFPRFYFISNDDLLEILGNSKNPEFVQPHLKKLFDNIHKIKLNKAPYAFKQECHGMMSGDGEYIDFLKVFVIDGPVEKWLKDVESSMKACLKVQLKKTREDLRRNLNRRDKWIMEWPGQPGITSAQIQWTVAVTRALFAAGDPRILKNPMKKVRKKLNKILKKFSIAIRGHLTKIQRLKVTAMVTIEIHSRDVTDKLYKTECKDLNGFDWLQQLRFYWEKEEKDCVVRQTNTFFRYGYEYLGNSGRLVVTPLTDRCYITLTTAFFLHRGGSPKGPAGTGKTETTKDLGKNLGMYVIVVNCSEGLDYKSMGKMFSGLAQTGAWGCFDEFNRINIEVLSVVAQQIMCILQAKGQNQRRFLFEGYDIPMVWSCGIFITMNPGYAGRTELPDNLKAMFRPISMIVPDTDLIAEIVLFGEGFDDTRTLARKVDTLYSLSKQQLSKQDHYDFGLRSMVALLRYAGTKKRVSKEMTDAELLILAMRDMNIPRLTSDDVPLFNGVIKDLFPTDEPPKFDYGALLTTITSELVKAGWQPTKKAILKCLELYETKNSRHSTMLVGRTQSGKSVTWKCLRDSMTSLTEAGEPGFVRCKEFVINPKALNQAELYGEFDLGTGDWSDGVISSIMRITCNDEKPDQKWILFDGPVDAVWIENMNSVMDDNKILTLINSERIAMPEQVSLLFEVGDLSQASPATVSRCGMVYSDYKDLGWKPYIESWLGRQRRKKVAEEYRKNIDFYLDGTLKHKALFCKELIPTTELNVVTSLTRLMDSLATKENGVNPKDNNTFDVMVRYYFVFSLIWSVCATTDEEGRKKFDGYLRELDPIFPAKDTVYDYFVDPVQRNLIHWNTLLTQHWEYDPELPFFKIIVPTVDTVRYKFVLENLLKNSYPVLMVGKVGTGKTSVVQSVLSSMDQEKYSFLTINISSQTTSSNIQNFIESRLERRAKGVFAPPRGKFLIAFCDDLNMPAKDMYGSQPPLELIRQWCDYRFWYDRSTQTTKFITNMFLVGAMGEPGGGRTEISARLQSIFCLVNMTFPEEPQIKRIFMTMLNQNLVDFEQEVKQLSEVITVATIDLYYSVSAKMLPTPSKIHYLFNLRDISRVYQGLLRASKKSHDSKINFSKLWFHECCRVFNDRLVNDQDREWFLTCLSDKLGTHLDQTQQSVCPNLLLPIFGDFLNSEGIYEDITDIKKLRTYMETVALPHYNNLPGSTPMNLVLFREALEHVSRISRVISQPKGSMLIVGIGGHGRQSLSRLSASICGYYIFEIEVNKRYKKADFREDLKKVYRRTGCDNKTCCFIMNDTQIVDEAFLEDLNNVLSSAEVPNLYKVDEFEDIKNTVMKSAVRAGYTETNDSIFKFLINRVQTNLHVVLCMSPIGDSFRHRVRQYPSLVNGTTIDWFERWPKDALLEVAHRWLADVNLDDRSNVLQEEMRDKCSTTFATVHFSVTDYCRIMLEEMKRHNYVTPINFLELVAGYKQLLAEKRKFFGDSAKRLLGGMAKIIETRSKVQDMSIELEASQKKVQEYQEQCDRVLEEITKQKTETDFQADIVNRRKEQVSIESNECQELARLAYAELADALPALDEANKALQSLNKKDLSEVKSYSQPPLIVAKVMEAVMVLRQVEPTWVEAKKQLGSADFLKELQEFDKDNISQKTLMKLGKYIQYRDFIPEIVGKVSLAAKTLCIWVRAMDLYGKIYNAQVAPKKAKLLEAESILKEKRRILAAQEEKIRLLREKLAELQKVLQEKINLKEELERKAELFRRNLERAAMLVENLAGERVRWEATITTLEEKLGYVVGDCLLASATVSYIGPFTSDYRYAMTKSWARQVRELHIPCDPEYDFCDFLANPTQVRMWNIDGLPRDTFCTENGVIVTRGRRTPLMVDPQSQALKWIKNMESENGLRVIDLRQADYLIVLEDCMANGTPVLMKDVGQDLDHTLSPVLSRTYMKQGERYVIKLGDKEIDFNPSFRFYITTKLMNPHYVPEIASRACIVNFMVKEQGLESQLLGIVVRKEKPQLEEMKDNLVVQIAAGKKKLEELESLILRLLSESKGSILEDEDLAITLKTSKETSDAVTKQLAVSQSTEIEIDASREQYRASATRASILFFVLNDMSRIDPMYQFSLDAYINLFMWSIEHSPKATTTEERIRQLNEFHTFSVYRNICRGLFEKHKLLFSFHMNAKIMEEARTLNMEEYQFFLKGGVILDRSAQLENSCSQWLPDSAWDNITELDKLKHFHGIVMSFEQLTVEWYNWYTHTEPEKAAIPGEWDLKLDEFQKLVVIRSLRPDRVPFKATTFISNNIGQKFTEPPVLDMGQVLMESSCLTPLIFVLSPGADPASGLFTLAESHKMSHRFFSLSLGQGQAPLATRMIEEGSKNGHWVFLANCHLSLSWMPQLDKLIETTMEQSPHKDFRLWLSSSPHPDFPLSILQSGIKMTTEPPKGIKSNMKRLYNIMPENKFQGIAKPEKFKKLLFALCFFHALLLERKKFQQLGWNIIYAFNDSDFEVSDLILSIYLTEYEDTPWEALKYLIAGVMYGGHVTDDWDRRLLMSYINQFFCDECLDVAYYKLSALSTYFIPKDGDLPYYMDIINKYPTTDHPEAFGQHTNADIASQISDANLIFSTLLSLQVQKQSSQRESRPEDKVTALAAEVMAKLPAPLDYSETRRLLKDRLHEPLNIVLLQEISRYNVLLGSIKKSLIELDKGIQGFVVMSTELEEIFQCILEARVPRVWLKAYPSLKPLGSWSRDLSQRINQLQVWASTLKPPVKFWLSGFTFPTGFLTAVLQRSARKYTISVDSLVWEFSVSTVEAANILLPPKDGVYVQGLYLEGASWDKKNSCLLESAPMRLVNALPIILFKPVEAKKKPVRVMYDAPCYIYPDRSGGQGRPPYVVTIELKPGSESVDHWIQRGVAVLMSLAT